MACINNSIDADELQLYGLAAATITAAILNVLKMGEIDKWRHAIWARSLFIMRRAQCGVLHTLLPDLSFSESGGLNPYYVTNYFRMNEETLLLSMIEPELLHSQFGKPISARHRVSVIPDQWYFSNEILFSFKFS